jgi:L-aminopeptidase/D-esterase-like protein
MVMPKGLTDIAGIRVGHASDFEGITGCTVILCEGGAVAGVDIRGSASGTQEISTLAPDHVTERIDALVFAGGSAYGLEASSGVRYWLESKGIGFQTSVARVPIVPSAILYDLAIGKANARPTRDMGMQAAMAATNGPVQEGNIGAGTGATVGKVGGMRQAMKGGIGSATVEIKGALVSALAAANGFGDVFDPRAARILAGARRSPDSRDFLDTADALKKGALYSFARGGSNTTLVCVATNARLNKVQAAKVAQLAQAGLTRAVWPAHTQFDGDVIFCLSLGNAQADVNSVGVAAAEAVCEAILRAVRAAETLGGVPGLKSLKARR